MDWINWIMELAGSFQQMSLSGARIDTQTLSQQALETEIWGGLRVLMISQKAAQTHIYPVLAIWINRVSIV